MSGYIAFVKKEFTENMKNYRFFILFAVDAGSCFSGRPVRCRHKRVF